MVASIAAAGTDAGDLPKQINTAFGSELQYDLASGVSGKVSKCALSHGKDGNVFYCFALQLHDLQYSLSCNS